MTRLAIRRQWVKLAGGLVSEERGRKRNDFDMIPTFQATI